MIYSASIAMESNDPDVLAARKIYRHLYESFKEETEVDRRKSAGRQGDCISSVPSAMRAVGLIISCAAAAAGREIRVLPNFTLLLKMN